MLSANTLLQKRYRIKRLLAQGGMGAVYLAEDEHFGIKVALKEALFKTPPSRRAFEREARLLERLNHPALPKVRGSFTDVGNQYLVMQFIEGQDLGQMLEERNQSGLGPFAADRVLPWAFQLLDALAYLHGQEKPVIHRDIKPRNLKLTPQGEVILLDFGLAKGAVAEMSQADSLHGYSPHYAPLEQMKGTTTGPRSDLYGLAATLHHLLTGEAPPMATARETALRKGQPDPLLPACEITSRAPGAMEAALYRAMALYPDDRPATAEEMREALRETRLPYASNIISPSFIGDDSQQGFTTPLSSSGKTAPITPRLVSRADQGTTNRGQQSLTALSASYELFLKAEVVVSYSNRDHLQALRIAEELKGAGVTCWMARSDQESETFDCAAAVHGIENCKVLLLICSNAAMRSWRVKQEMQLAWKYMWPCLPVLIEELQFPEQSAYWFESGQWINVIDDLSEQWLPQILLSLESSGAHPQKSASATSQGMQVIQPLRFDPGLNGLRSVARFTDQIWPLPAERVERIAPGFAPRGMGAPQPGARRVHRLGSRLRLAIESDREWHLLLLDEGPEEIVYCLCPSWFAPNTRLLWGRNYLPQVSSRYDSFTVTGRPGREHLLAIISDAPLDLDWLPSDPNIPAHVLTQADIDALLARLRNLEGETWTALSTYFDILL